MTEKELNQALEVQDYADSVAQKQGFDTIEELTESVKKGIESEKASERITARESGVAAVSHLPMMVLEQEFEGADLGDFNFEGCYVDHSLRQGNAIDFTKRYPTGHNTYTDVKNQFVPTGFTSTNASSFTIQMYDIDSSGGGQVQLNKKQAYQFHKDKVMQPNEWIQYFTKGNLQAFVNDIRGEFGPTFKAFKFDNLVSFVTNTMVTNVASKKNTINGVAKNLFDAIATEVYPLLRELQAPSSDYNYNQDNPRISKLTGDNLVVLVNPRIRQMMESGVMTQLFQSRLLEWSTLVKPENMPVIGKKLEIGGINDVIKTTDEFYIPEDTIIIFDKSALHHVTYLDEMGSQSYTRNLSLEINSHVWGARDYEPWSKFIVYKNPHLKVMPGSEVEILNLDDEALTIANVKKSKKK